jgi:hypothetical protein
MRAKRACAKVSNRTRSRKKGEGHSGGRNVMKYLDIRVYIPNRVGLNTGAQSVGQPNETVRSGVFIDLFRTTGNDDWRAISKVSKV